MNKYIIILDHMTKIDSNCVCISPVYTVFTLEDSNKVRMLFRLAKLGEKHDGYNSYVYTERGHYVGTFDHFSKAFDKTERLVGKSIKKEWGGNRAFELWTRNKESVAQSRCDENNNCYAELIDNFL